MLPFLLISMALLVCNAIYCSRKMFADFKGAEPAAGVWGLLALSGALMALTGLIWGLLASLAHY